MRKPARKLPLSFFRRDAETVARELVGALLVRRLNGTVRRARVVETEAYVGPHDLACHASRGRTARTEAMFLPGGHAYVYFIYGMYDMLNVVTGDAEDPQAVLIRAAEPLDGWSADLSGPGKLTRALGITREQNSLVLIGPTLHFRARQSRPEIAISARIGVDYAREWTDKPLRFFDAQSASVSRHPAGYRNDGQKCS